VRERGPSWTRSGTAAESRPHSTRSRGDPATPQIIGARLTVEPAYEGRCGATVDGHPAAPERRRGDPRDAAGKRIGVGFSRPAQVGELSRTRGEKGTLSIAAGARTGARGSGARESSVLRRRPPSSSDSDHRPGRIPGCARGALLEERPPTDGRRQAAAEPAKPRERLRVQGVIRAGGERSGGRGSWLRPPAHTPASSQSGQPPARELGVRQGHRRPRTRPRN